jgi:pimeloyl-ACP methyl ester carboxylesterase
VIRPFVVWLMVFGLTALACAGPPHGEAVPLTLGTVVDTLIQVGDQSLHFRIASGRLPAIVLESGGGADASEWAGLLPQLAETTRSAVVSYDRAGFGRSDLPSTPYDVRRELAALHSALQHLHLADSIIIVGHSYGGLLAQIYAHEYSRTVLGLILVDPNTVAFVDAVGGASSPLLAVSFDTTRPLSKLEMAGKRQVDAFPQTVAVARRAPASTHLPMVVVTAGSPFWPTDAANRAWRAAHEALAGGGSRRWLVIATGAGHQIPAARPDLIIAAVAQILSITRPGR